MSSVPHSDRYGYTDRYRDSHSHDYRDERRSDRPERDYKSERSRYSNYNLPQNSGPQRISLKYQYLKLIEEGKKSVEGRTNTKMYQDIRKGDEVIFFSGNNEVRCRIKAKQVYNSFRAMLQAEGVSNCLPGVVNLDEGVKIYEAIPRYKENAAKWGVIAWQIEVLRNERSHYSRDAYPQTARDTIPEVKRNEDKQGIKRVRDSEEKQEAKEPALKKLKLDSEIAVKEKAPSEKKEDQSGTKRAADKPF